MEKLMVNGAQALAHRLEAHGVEVIFGLPGEENLAVVEALASTPIKLVVTRHEQHAAFMAATYGRLTGRPGICLATLGPGATNLLTGLAHAELGGMPVIAITGQKPRTANSEGSFQVLDIPAMAQPVTRWATSIDDHRNIVATVDEAFAQAMAGRPGAVLVELPEDVAGERFDAVFPPVPLQPTSVPSSGQLEAAATAINAAQNPVVLVSGGANSEAHSAALTEFAETTGIGVLATQLGKGAIDEGHPLSVRSLGMHRPDYAHLALDQADLVITMGYQPVEHPPLAWNPDSLLPIVHIASSPAAIERGYQPEHQLVGQLPETLAALAPLLNERDTQVTAHQRMTIEALLAGEDEGSALPASPLHVVRTVRELLDADDIVALDNGAYKIWFSRHYPVHRPATLLLDNALATMGAGLATAMTAASLNPHVRTLAVCGDGGFLMNVQDLETAQRMGLDLTVLVVRDNEYGFIAWHQDEQGRPNDGISLTNPDLVLLAESFGCTAHRVSDAIDLKTALSQALNEPGVSLVDCPLDYSINEQLGLDLLAIAKKAFDQ